jgi:hypothetical protein
LGPKNWNESITCRTARRLLILKSTARRPTEVGDRRWFDVKASERDAGEWACHGGVAGTKDVNHEPGR